MSWDSFVQKHHVAIVSTHDSVTPNGVPIYYYFVKDDNAFYFITKSETIKYANIKKIKKPPSQSSQKTHQRFLLQIVSQS